MFWWGCCRTYKLDLEAFPPDLLPKIMEYVGPNDRGFRSTCKKYRGPSRYPLSDPFRLVFWGQGKFHVDSAAEAAMRHGVRRNGADVHVYHKWVVARKTQHAMFFTVRIRHLFDPLDAETSLREGTMALGEVYPLAIPVFARVESGRIHFRVKNRLVTPIVRFRLYLLKVVSEGVFARHA